MPRSAKQDNDVIAADVLTAEPTGNGGGPACELTVTEPNRPDGHRDGVGGALDLPVEPFGERVLRGAAWSRRHSNRPTTCFRSAIGNSGRRRDPLLGIGDD